MDEPLSNVGYVCPTHAPKPGKYAKHHPVDFLGANVKTSFRAPDGRIEHMWVFILGIDSDEKTLLGTLNNDPVFATQYRYGQRVKVQTWEVEDVLNARFQS